MDMQNQTTIHGRVRKWRTFSDVPERERQVARQMLLDGETSGAQIAPMLQINPSQASYFITAELGLIFKPDNPNSPRSRVGRYVEATAEQIAEVNQKLVDLGWKRNGDFARRKIEKSDKPVKRRQSYRVSPVVQAVDEELSGDYLTTEEIEGMNTLLKDAGETIDMLLAENKDLKNALANEQGIREKLETYINKLEDEIGPLRRAAQDLDKVRATDARREARLSQQYTADKVAAARGRK